jgi:uncharacterized damage-inducible protein DinB
VSSPASGSVTIARPGPDEYAPAFGRYVERVPQRPLLEELARQGRETAATLGALPAEKARYRYAPDKWSVTQVAGHLSDCERVFAYRTLWIARGDQAPLPGFEEDDWMKTAPWDRRELPDVLAELAAVRQATLALLGSLDDAAFERRGTANGASISVRALAYIMAGHELHHRAVLRERYGIA